MTARRSGRERWWDRVLAPRSGRTVVVGLGWIVGISRFDALEMLTRARRRLARRAEQPR